MNARTRLVYGILLAVWALIVVWQIEEHMRVRRSARDELYSRARDVSGTVGVLIRAQRRWMGAIPKDRLEGYITDLLKTNDVGAIALLNKDLEKLASAPQDFDPPRSLIETGQPYWSDGTVTMMNLVPLGTNVMGETEPPPTPVVIDTSADLAPFGTNRFGTNRLNAPGPGPTTNTFGPSPERGSAPPPRPPDGPRGGGPRRFGRPPWMSEEEYHSLIDRRGIHGFVISLSTQKMTAECSRDLWLRAFISLLSAVSVAGFGLAWRNQVTSAELELRLVRASELNARLKETNLAAAGLAHETRNPLNIVRGLAQMISKREDAPPEIRAKSREIVDETDRVTAQLNDFINFSKPREVRRSNVALGSVANEVVRALGSDVEEKCVRLEVASSMPSVEADEQLLRQALFNLLLNAIQAVDRGGEIQVAAGRTSGNGAWLEIRDNGPGVPAENRDEVFKPYFTTHAGGTGLGLAVVHQIVLAHGWDITCLPNDPKGAIFRINHLKAVG